MDRVLEGEAEIKEQHDTQLTETDFDRKRRMIGLFGGPICALLVFLLPIPELSLPAHKMLAILVFVCMWWITEPVAIPVTSLIGPTLAVLFGVVPLSIAFMSFANPLIFLFIGGFVLAGAMNTHRLDERFAFGILSMSWVGSSPKRIFLAMGLATTLLSGWINNAAAAAMMFPIAMGLLKAIEDMFHANGREINLMNYKYATGLMLMTSYGASVGGILTPIGSAPNLITLSLLEQMAGIQVTFFEWMAWGSIAMVFYFILAAAVLHLMFPADVDYIDGAEAFINEKKKQLGAWTQGQKNTLFAFVLTVFLLVFPGFLSIGLGSGHPFLKLYEQVLPAAVVILGCALMLFLMPIDVKKRQFTLTWKQAAHEIDWGTLILFGGGISMGTMMFKTGLSNWIGDLVVKSMGGDPSMLMMTLVFCVISLVMSELTSHTAATNMVAPLGITAAISAGFSPVPIAIGIALASSLGFMLPVSTPPNAIVYASGYIPITKMIKTGFFIDVLGILFVTVPIAVYVVMWVVG